MNEKIDIKGPACWSDLDVAQLRTVAWAFGQRLTRQEMLLLLFCRLCGLRMCGGGETLFCERQTKCFSIEPWQVRSFCDRFAWLIDTNPDDTANPTRVNGHLMDVAFEDYFSADTQFFCYSKTGDPKHVRAALWAFEGWQNKGKKCPLRHVLWSLQNWRLYVRKTEAEAVAMWWIGVQHYLKRKYPRVFGGGTQKEYVPLEAYADIMLMLNENRPQDNEAINRAQVHDVLAALENKMERHDRMKAELGKRGL